MWKGRLLLGLVLAGAMAGTGWALSFTQEKVGGLDELISSTRLPNSSPDTERGWAETAVASWLGVGSIALKLEGTVGFSAAMIDDYWKAVEGTAWWATPVPSHLDYFLVKIGAGGLGSSYPNSFLFANRPGTGFAVVEHAQFVSPVPQNFTITRFSHLTTFVPDNEGEDPGGDSGGDPIPEPGTMLLLGTGLLGIARLGRRTAPTQEG